MVSKLDVLFVNGNASKKIYQGLAKNHAAIEPPIWAMLLANHVRSRGFSCAILDCEAEHLTLEQATQRVKDADPRLVVFTVYGQQPSASTQNMQGATELADAIYESYGNEFPIMFIGAHVAALPYEVLSIPSVKFIAGNEGVYTLSNLLRTDLKQGLEGILGLGWMDGGNPRLNLGSPVIPQAKLEDDLPGQAWDLIDVKRYRTANWHTNYGEIDASPFASVYTSLGCIFKCLHGDTLVNTIYGPIAISELADKFETIPVYTYDRKAKEVVIRDAINIKKTGTKRQLVRVTFDDGTWIDCTPDHKFLAFTIGNQSGSSEEFEVEAKDLKPKMSVRAIKEYLHQNYNRVDIAWGRSKRSKRYRLIMEYKLGRKLLKSEPVHHIDGNSANDHPDNLELCINAKDHFKRHPEIAVRMRENNPTRNMTPEWREKLRFSATGKTRSLEQRLKYRDSKLGTKNPNYQDGHSAGQSSRITEINHKVVSVQLIEGEHDTYCMTVPGYDWFFANNVLVHNCSFCMINIINRTDPGPTIASADSALFRYWSPEFMIKQFDEIAKLGVKNVKIADEMYVLKPKHFLRLSELLAERDYGFNIWCYSRIDTIKEEYLEKLKKSGVNWVGLGIEAANQVIRREVTKGRFEDVDIRKIVGLIKQYDINVGANYIFGLPEETLETMEQTMQLAFELNGEYSNFYSAMAYPGSPLHIEAKANGVALPDTYDGYSQHSYNCFPLSGKYLTNADILKFRDQAWFRYNNRPEFLSFLETKFGSVARKHIEDLSKIRLQRKILGD